MSKQAAPLSVPSNPAKPSGRYVRVVIASPLRRHFDYLPKGNDQAVDYPIGCRVRVPFGRRELVGLVIGHADTTAVEPTQLKHITALLDQQPVFNATLSHLARWISDYYHHPYGDVALNLLPGHLRKGGNRLAYTERCWQITTAGLGLPATALARAPKQQALLTTLREQYQTHAKAAAALTATGEVISTTINTPLSTSKDKTQASTNTYVTQTALTTSGHSVDAAKALAKKQLIEMIECEYYPTSCQSLLQGLASDPPLTLNQQQRHVFECIIAATERYRSILLEGITGSGKTEVYLQAIDYVLSNGKQALVLVPEIGLTPQTIARFVHRFRVPIAVFHSSLTERERLAAWTAAQQDHAKIIIGTRSAIFTPMANPGLIVVDEEHDLSYKQQDGLRYSARDVAVVRAQAESIPIVLGSATPSLESLYNCVNGKYEHCRLDQRTADAQPPDIQLVDIRNAPLHEGLSDPAIAAITAALQNGQQAMVFINRRGFSPLLICHDCGWHAQCEHCDARLTVHNRPNQLRCHHCDHRQAMPTQCLRCQSTQLLSIGQGTERSEIALNGLFPNTPIIRIDRDTTQNKAVLGEQLTQINTGLPAILVGTQMLAKGHHFPALSTVVILDIDQGLYHPDFRGPEKTVQLLTQVAGRAGREAQQGLVVIQTHLPDHPLLSQWRETSYQGISDALLEERARRSLPPYTYMASVRADSRKPQQAQQFLQQVKTFATAQTTTLKTDNQQAGEAIIGPLPAHMEKRAGRYRALLLLKYSQRAERHNAVNAIVERIETLKKPSDLRWAIDIDPQEML